MEQFLHSTVLYDRGEASNYRRTAISSLEYELGPTLMRPDFPLDAGSMVLLFAWTAADERNFWDELSSLSPSRKAPNPRGGTALPAGD